MIPKCINKGSSPINTCTSLLLLLFTCFSTQIIAQTYTAGNTYFDSTGYVEYQAGNLPVIISVPHGGYLEPDEIPDRDCDGCSYLRDSYTQELAREINDAFIETTGCYPHIVINLLHRKKFDANRDIEDAADGNPTVEQSWYAYHELMDAAKTKITAEYGRGLFLDLHGHAHDIQRLELGYTLSKSELQLSDDELNTAAYIEESSIRTLVSDNLESLSHAELLRGASSFGTLIDDEGFPAVPSLADPFPLDSEPYFSGGYNTIRHGSMDEGTIDGIQIECNSTIRFDPVLREAFASSVTVSIIDFIDLHFNDQFKDNYCSLLTNTAELSRVHSLNIFPNPAINHLHLQTNLDVIQITVYNTLGQKLSTLLWEGMPLDISYLKKGLYFLELKNKGLQVDSKILIKQ